MKYPIIAQRLKEAMNDQNMKAVELSAKSGVLKSSISQYINGSHSMSNKAAGAIGAVLGVNPVWLMGFDVDMDPFPDSQSEQEKLKAMELYLMYKEATPDIQDAVELLLKSYPRKS